MSPVETRLRAGRVVAIFRGEADAGYLLEAAAVLEAAGFTSLEITLDSPNAGTSLARLRERFGRRLLLGAGTVTTAAEADRARDAGVDFLVAPHFDGTLLEHVRRGDLPFYPGVLTPSEIHGALRAGCRTVKLFPASLGGPSYLATLAGPLADVDFLPTGGIGLDEAGGYLEAGALAVGLGSALTKRAPSLTAFEARVATLRRGLEGAPRG